MPERAARPSWRSSGPALQAKRRGEARSLVPVVPASGRGARRAPIDTSHTGVPTCKTAQIVWVAHDLRRTARYTCRSAQTASGRARFARFCRFRAAPSRRRRSGPAAPPGPPRAAPVELVDRRRQRDERRPRCLLDPPPPGGQSQLASTPGPGGTARAGSRAPRGPAVLLGLAAGLSAAAAIAIAAILTHSFDRIAARLIGTSLVFSVFTALGAGGAPARRQSKLAAHQRSTIETECPFDFAKRSSRVSSEQLSASASATYAASYAEMFSRS
jgi:hypothetical protein